MSQSADLYAILRFYANRTRSPDVPVDVFIGFLEKYSKRYAPERPDLAQWVQDTGRKVWSELTKLSESGRCALETDEKGTKVSLPQFFVDVVQQAYASADETSELPFPDEAYLKIVIPGAILRPINLEMDLPSYLSSPQDTTIPILKLIFPDGAGSTLLLSTMIPKRVMELALLKIRHYLRSHNNKEYLQHKLAPTFQGKESHLKDALNLLLVRPFDALADLEKAGDFSFPFWAYFSSMVKGDIRKKNDLLPEDYAALQSVMIVEVFNNYYKGKVTKEKEAETAFHNLSVQMEKPPFLYTMDDIVRFTDTKGIPLLGQYTKEALEEYLKNKTTTGGPEELPEILIVRGTKDERWLVKKTLLLPLCVKLLGEVRPRIKSAISQRWFKLLGDYRSEPAMEDDGEFDKELKDLILSTQPSLSALLEDEKLYLVYTELEASGNGVPESGRLFYKGALASLSELLLLKRKDMLTDVKMLLPFWYSMPIFSKIIAFFKGLGKKKKQKRRVDPRENQGKPNGENDENDESRANQGAQDKKAALKAVAQKAQSRLVPDGYTPDAYLKELLDRWNRLINAQAKENLTEDVNSLIRDYLRKTIRTIRTAQFTPERISELANVLAENANLQKLPARDSLRQYIQLYMIRLLVKS